MFIQGLAYLGLVLRWSVMSEKSRDIMDLFEDPKEEEEPEEEEELINTSVDLQLPSNALVAFAKEAGVEIPKEKYNIIENFMDRAKHGHQAALPMICRANCPFLGMCPLEEAGLALPIGKKCPAEKALIHQWVAKTITALNIDPNDPEYAVDIDMVYELAGVELLRMRAGHHMSTEPSLVEEKIVGYSPQGQPIYDEKPKVALLILEKYSRVVGKLREQLLATRKSQAQVGQLAGDISIRTANIMARAKLIAKERRGGGSIQDIDFEVKEDGEARTD